jgi:hypothetical protein
MNTQWATLACGWTIEIRLEFLTLYEFSVSIYSLCNKDPISPNRAEVLQAIKIWYNSFQSINFNDYLNKVFSKV